MSNLYSLYRNYSFGKNSCGINFNSPIPTTLQDPSPYTTRCTLRTEDKTRSGWDDDDSHRCSAKCKSRFGIFAIFVERRQPRARQNKVEEREREREVVCVRRTRYHGTSIAHTLWPPCLVIVSRCKISRSIYAPLPATGRKLAVGPRRLSRLIHLAWKNVDKNGRL